MNDDLLNNFLLEAFPNPERKGCPDEKTLRAYAEGRLPPENEVLPHISSCSECYREYRHYRQDWKESQQKSAPNDPHSASVSGPIPIAPPRSRKWLPAAAAVLLAIGAGQFALWHHRTSSPEPSQVASASPVGVTVDLFDAVTARGGGGEEPTPLQEVSLPAAAVELNVTLPRFSEAGKYDIRVSKDRAGMQVAASGSGDAIENAGRVGVKVMLDLRATQPGTYFLATVRGSDNGTYYYPLKVK